MHRASCLILLLAPALAFGQVPTAALQYQRDLTRIAQSVWGLSAPVATLGAQLQQESAFDAVAVSPAGAAGLAQMMPRTARDLARIYPALNPVDVFNPAWSLRAQSYLMLELWRRYADAFDCFERLSFALASYNQGPGWTARQRAASSMPQFWFGASEFELVGKARAAVDETTNYVRRIMLWLRPRYVGAGWSEACR